MDRKELIDKYVNFFKSQGHKEIPNSSLIPSNDPTVLFTTAGMHPIVPYLLGQKHPLGKRLCNVQRCIRTQDIDEVGDTYHHTFFEMLGNWSLGDYFKEEAIKMTFEFHTKILEIPLTNYAITVFGGNKSLKIPKDEESESVWLSLGVPKERIAFLEDNWWGPAGKTGPCGPDTEQFFWTGKTKAPKKFDPEDKRWVEIGNDVLMQYLKDEKEKFNPAEQKNIDFGGGVERTVAVFNGLDDNYLTGCFKPIIEKIEKLSGKKYGNSKNPEVTRAMRIIADHLKASVFIIADGIIPKNTEQGYVLRRLIRRAVRFGRILEIENFTSEVAEPIFKIYKDYEVLKDKGNILKILEEEESNFNKTITKGLHIFHNLAKHKKGLSGKEAFLLYQSYGFPFEMTLEILKEEKIKFDEKNLQKTFERELKKHQELSRTAAEGKFKSGLADNSEQTTKLHTSTHMLNAALKIILKDKDIHQKGSNITPERLRFDFNFPRKLTQGEISEIENLINKKISEGLEVKREEMPLKKALASGAEAEFGAKYPEIVSVYTIIDPSEKRGFFSREICTGPHVKNTSEIGHFKIKKEESSSAGVRRIKAIAE